MNENKKVNVKNQLELGLFCALIGAVAGALVWALLKVMAVGTDILWTWIPGTVSIPFYTVIVCTVGAAITGVFRKNMGIIRKIWRRLWGKLNQKKDMNIKTCWL